MWYWFSCVYMRRDLPLAERVVQRLVDRLRRDAHARSRHAVDDQRRGKTPRLLVGGHVAQFRNRFSLSINLAVQ